MSEIDKLINQAFPDELRDVEPIDVDEDAILQLTLEQLGLKPSPRLEIPELPVRPAKRGKRRGGKRQEPEFVEVPVVVHHRWMDWAGWAIAACLVLVFAVNWGPWLVNNLGFGLGPRSAGDTVSSASESSSAPESSGDTSFFLQDGQVVTVAVASVTYGEEDTATIDLSITPVTESETLDLDQFDIRAVADKPDSVERVSRSNEGNMVSLKYRLNGYRAMVLEIKQARPLTDSSGNEAGFGYQYIDTIQLNFLVGEAWSLDGNGRSEFAKYSSQYEDGE